VRALRDAEIQDRYEVGFSGEIGHVDVRRLDVAMHDAERMGRHEALQDLRADAPNAFDGQRPCALQERSERVPTEQLEDQKARAITRVAEIEDADDVRVRQALHEIDLTAKARNARFICRHFAREHLERDEPAMSSIERAIHGTRRALPDQRLDAIPSRKIGPRREQIGFGLHRRALTRLPRCGSPGQRRSRCETLRILQSPAPLNPSSRRAKRTLKVVSEP
jgi:hypothetical protein